MAKMQTVEFSVKGMTCSGCENTVMKSVKKLDGIAEVLASHEKETAVVKFDTSLVNPAEIEKAIVAAGYTVEGFSKKE
jgi:copper ion binding protein